MKRILKHLKKWKFPVLATIFMLIVMKCVLFIGFVPTESMEPTLKKGSYIVACRIYSALEVGDIIVFRHEGRLLIKRIAATGGDCVKRNGVDMAVPEGSYYVLGDNAENSCDSRYWDEPFVSESDIIAKLLFP